MVGLNFLCRFINLYVFIQTIVLWSSIRDFLNIFHIRANKNHGCAW